MLPEFTIGTARVSVEGMWVEMQLDLDDWLDHYATYQVWIDRKYVGRLNWHYNAAPDVEPIAEVFVARATILVPHGTAWPLPNSDSIARLDDTFAREVITHWLTGKPF